MKILQKYAYFYISDLFTKLTFKVKHHQNKYVIFHTIWIVVTL